MAQQVKKHVYENGPVQGLDCKGMKKQPRISITINYKKNLVQQNIENREAAEDFRKVLYITNVVPKAYLRLLG